MSPASPASPAGDVSSPAPIEPDGKDWTWVLDAPCPECGFVASAVEVPGVAGEIRRNAEVWVAALGGHLAAVRPRPDVWSPTEYACHVRDVHRVFGERVRLMLEHDEPTFANWDQDAAAVEERYDLQQPEQVAAQLHEAASAVAEVYDAVPASSHQRRGRRDDGSGFSVESIARYHLHDVVHHLWDVRRAVTVVAYDEAAPTYAEVSRELRERVRADLDAFASRLGPGARVLEIGTAGGRDALALEDAGVSVRRTDVSPGFVDLLRAEGHAADVVDPLVDDLADPSGGGPYDGVWANASLLHVARADLGTVLTRLAGATRAGGVLRMSVKQGDGEGWSVHGSVALPRMFTYWREESLRDVVDGAGWRIEQVDRSEGLRGEHWLSVTAVREGEPA